MKKQKLLSSQEVAEYLTKRDGKPISIRGVQFEIKKGYIKAIKKGGSYVVDKDDLKNYKRRPTGIKPR